MNENSLRDFLNLELKTCLERREKLEVARSLLDDTEDRDEKDNLTRSLMHYEGRVRQIRRTFRALDGDGDIMFQDSFVLDTGEITCGCPEPFNKYNRCKGLC